MMLISGFSRSALVLFVLVAAGSGCSSCGRNSDELDADGGLSEGLHEPSNNNAPRQSRLTQPPHQPPLQNGSPYQLTHRRDAGESTP